MKLLSILFLVIPLIAFSQTEQTKPASPDDEINALLKESGIVGVGAAVIVDKKLVWMKGFGYSDAEKKTPFTPTTIMNIASITKTFTGVCIMSLVEKGKLSLDEDINKYLPFKIVNPYFPNEKITLRHLATHTSSIVDRDPIYADSYVYGGDSPEALGAFLKNYFDPNGKYYAKENFLDKKPGAHRSYCNIGAGVAGYIVELVTKKDLRDYGREVIFKPLGMNSTTWRYAGTDLSRHTKQYDRRGDTLKVIDLFTAPTYSDGGIRTTVEDLSKFYLMLLNDGEYNGTRILKKETVQEIQRYHYNEPNTPENVNPAKLNQGIFWATKQGGTRIGHAGTDAGIKAEMLSDLSKEVGVILFDNTELPEAGLIKYHYGIFDALCKYGDTLKKK